MTVPYGQRGTKKSDHSIAADAPVKQLPLTPTVPPNMSPIPTEVYEVPPIHPPVVVPVPEKPVGGINTHVCPLGTENGGVNGIFLQDRRAA